MSTDNGNGMKFVALIILFNLIVFAAGVFAVWVGDDLVHPAKNTSSVPAPITH
jgi:hypothetical protein